MINFKATALAVVVSIILSGLLNALVPQPFGLALALTTSIFIGWYADNIYNMLFGQKD